MELKMMTFANGGLAILFMLKRTPSAILIKRMQQFKTALEKEFGDIFVKKDLDFTNDNYVKKKMYDLMVQILKFDVKELIEMNNR